jgi:hypothetical protein
MKSLLITGGRVLDPLGELHRPPVLDILVEEGKISAVGELARLRAGTFPRHPAAWPVRANPA